MYSVLTKVNQSLIVLVMLWMQLVEHFFQSLANTSGMTLHIRQVCNGLALLKWSSFRSSFDLLSILFNALQMGVC